jgi:hypothetical protein
MKCQGKKLASFPTLSVGAGCLLLIASPPHPKKENQPVKDWFSTVGVGNEN